MKYYEEFFAITDLVNLLEEFTENSRCNKCRKYLREDLVKVKAYNYYDDIRELTPIIRCWRCRGYTPMDYEKFR